MIQILLSEPYCPNATLELYNYTVKCTNFHYLDSRCVFECIDEYGFENTTRSLIECFDDFDGNSLGFWYPSGQPRCHSEYERSRVCFGSVGVKVNLSVKSAKVRTGYLSNCTSGRYIRRRLPCCTKHVVRPYLCVYMCI